VLTEEQLDEEREWEEEDEMMNETFGGDDDDDDDDDDDESFEEIYLDKPDSSYSKLVGLLQINKKVDNKVENKVEKRNMDIDKVDKIDVFEKNYKCSEENRKVKGNNNNECDKELNVNGEF